MKKPETKKVRFRNIDPKATVASLLSITVGPKGYEFLNVERDGTQVTLIYRKNIDVPGPVPDSRLFPKITALRLNAYRFFIDPAGWPCIYCRKAIRAGQDVVVADLSDGSTDFFHIKCFPKKNTEGRAAE